MDRSPWDSVAAHLRELRAEAGDPSYADIAQRITTARVERGVGEHAARVARTTVYDAFRAGRRRIDAVLVTDIARALGADAATADRWLVEARAEARRTDPAPEPAPVPEPSPEPVPEREPEPEPAPVPRGLVLVLVGSVLLNLLGRACVSVLDLPLYLDMAGTAVASLVLGPWWGVLVGVATNGLGSVGNGPSWAFALVNVVGALVWGYGARRLGLGRTLPRFFLLNVLVALACTAVASVILLVLYGGSIGHAQDTVARTVEDLLGHRAVAVTIGNAVTSVADKVISGFVALTVIASLPARMRAGRDVAVPPV